MEEKEEEVIINVYYSIIHTYMYIGGMRKMENMNGRDESGSEKYQ